MPTTLLAPTSGTVSNAKRISWKSRYGDLVAALEGAREELDVGQLENAWTAYTIALNHWLKQRWTEQSGKTNSPITDPKELANKLRSANVLDSWHYEALKVLPKRPTPVEFRHIDVFAAFVEALAK